METMENFNVPQVAEINLSYRSKVKLSACPKVQSSSEAYRLLYARWDKDKIELVEQFKVILLNRANRVIGELLLGTGSGSGVVVDVKLIIFTVIKSNASAFIISHNHPSGKLIPSEQDRRLTQKVKIAADSMDINLLDHIIVTNEGYYSFADEGLI